MAVVRLRPISTRVYFGTRLTERVCVHSPYVQMFKWHPQRLDIEQPVANGLFKDVFNEDTGLEELEVRAEECVFDDPFGLNEKEQKRPEIDFVFDNSDEEASDENELLSEEEPEAFKSWDAFHNVSELPARTTKHLSRMLSERDAYTVDIVMINEPKSKVIPQHKLVSCLENLALGRQSLMFYYSEKRMLFLPVSPTAFRLVACSSVGTSQIINSCVKCGSQWRRLKYTVATIRTQKVPEPVLIAFADCVEQVLKAIGQHVHPLTNLIELSEFIGPIARIVELLARLVGCSDVSKSVRLNRLPEPHRLIDALYSRSLTYESSSLDMFLLTRLILERTTEPYLRQVEELVGLAKSGNFEPQLFIRELDGEISVDQELVPQFLSKLAPLICESFVCFKIHRVYGDYWSNTRWYHAEKSRLQWCFNSKSVASKKIEADNYEINALNENQKNDDSHEASPLSMADPEEDIEGLIHQMDQYTISDNDELQDVCTRILAKMNTTDFDSCPMDITPSLSFGQLLMVQHRLGNDMVRTLFNKDDANNLEMNLNLIRNIYLLQDGNLCVLLEQALFDHLCTPNIYPPSAAQLNHYISDMVEEAAQAAGAKTRAVLNFGMGKPSTYESFRATDMFRMVYNVPEPLRLIFPRRVLQHYNEIFARLIQQMRLWHSLKHDREADGIQAKHFVMCLVAHYKSSIDRLFRFEERSSTTLQAVIDQSHQVIRHLYREFFLHDGKLTQLIDEISQQILDRDFKSSSRSISILVASLPSASFLKHSLDYNRYYS